MPSLTSIPDNPLFSSPGVVNVIGTLKSHRRPSGSAHFPWVDGWTGDNIRVKVIDENTTDMQAVLQGWFMKLIGPAATARQRIDECGIDDNVACFAAVAWNNNILEFCRMQVLVTKGGNLMDFYRASNSDVTANYYRLELDPYQPGPMFTEPQPHVHTVPSGSPRFAFFSQVDEFLPLSFLEFIYLNHQAEKWRIWARNECNFRNPMINFDGVLQAFNDGRLWRDRAAFLPELTAIKCILGSVKRNEVRDSPKLSQELPLFNY
jgi:hypothetical protein